MDERSAQIKKDLEDSKSNSADVDGFFKTNDLLSKLKKAATIETNL